MNNLIKRYKPFLNDFLIEDKDGDYVNFSDIKKIHILLDTFLIKMMSISNDQKKQAKFANDLKIELLHLLYNTQYNACPREFKNHFKKTLSDHNLSALNIIQKKKDQNIYWLTNNMTWIPYGEGDMNMAWCSSDKLKIKKTIERLKANEPDYEFETIIIN